MEVRPTLTKLLPARFEDMTQPMGPLEEGDQALIDAIHRSPAANLNRLHSDGTHTDVRKWDDFGGVKLNLDTDNPDGTKQQVSTDINYLRKDEKEGIKVEILTTPEDEDAEPTFVKVVNNSVEAGESDNPEHNRAEAQKIKLEVAKKINAATDAATAARTQHRAA